MGGRVLTLEMLGLQLEFGKTWDLEWLEAEENMTFGGGCGHWHYWLYFI